MQVMKWTRVHIGTQPNLKIIYSSPPCRVGQKTIWSNVIQRSTSKRRIVYTGSEIRKGDASLQHLTVMDFCESVPLCK